MPSAFCLMPCIKDLIAAECEDFGVEDALDVSLAYAFCLMPYALCLVLRT